MHPIRDTCEFLKLTYKQKLLDDDWVLLSELRYPKYDANSWFPDCIRVVPLAARIYTIECHNVRFSNTFHDCATVRHLKLAIASRFSVPYGCISIDVDDTTLLNSFGSDHIQVRIVGFCSLKVSSSGKTCDVFFPSSGTVLELISFLQIDLFPSGTRDLTIVSDGVEVSQDQTVSPGRVEAVVGREWSVEETTVSFCLDVGPPYHVRLPLCTPLA
jgi:hypothetical protein